MKINSEVPLVFVETGRRPSKYLCNNLNLARQRFPNRKIILILSKKYQSEVNIHGVEKFLEEDIPKSSMLLKFESVKKEWSGLQKNYWTNTTKRFFILGMYMEENHIEQVVHLESDCILLNEKWIDEEFAEPNWGLKYPKQHHRYGCASILIVNRLEIFNNFLQFIIENWSRGETTDMNLLGEFTESELLASFLPSGDLIDGSSTHIYDGVSIGQYFLGTDARNQRLPCSTRGHRDSNPGAISLNNPRIQLNSLGVFVYKDIDSPELELVNIHMHSKRIPKSYKTLKKIILRDSRGRINSLWRLGTFDKIVFAERLVSFLNRRILRKKHFEFRLR
jgi:hypothetical protein